MVMTFANQHEGLEGVFLMCASGADCLPTPAGCVCDHVMIGKGEDLDRMLRLMGGYGNGPICEHDAANAEAALRGLGVGGMVLQ